MVLAVLAAPVGTQAQADYRNLDPGRPIAVEDAQPVEYRALELKWELLTQATGQAYSLAD